MFVNCKHKRRRIGEHSKELFAEWRNRTNNGKRPLYEIEETPEERAWINHILGRA